MSRHDYQDHLHRETNIIPIKEYNAMLSKQYTLSCHLLVHPSYSLVNQGPPERNLRKCATREYKEKIESFIPRGLNQANFKLGMKSIHTVDVRSTVNNYSNPITANRLSPIDGSEQELPRRTRATLAQLRSGWCHITNHYTS